MYLFIPLKPILFRRSRYQCSNSRSTRELNEAIKEKKKYISIHFCQFIIWRGGRGETTSSISFINLDIHSFFLRMLQVESHFETAPFLSILFSSSSLPTRRKNVGIFPLYFLSFLPPSPPPSFFLFISFHLVHRAISEIDFSYPVRGRRAADRLCTRI